MVKAHRTSLAQEISEALLILNYKGVGLNSKEEYAACIIPQLTAEDRQNMKKKYKAIKYIEKETVRDQKTMEQKTEKKIEKRKKNSQRRTGKSSNKQEEKNRRNTYKKAHQ